MVPTNVLRAYRHFRMIPCPNHSKYVENCWFCIESALSVKHDKGDSTPPNQIEWELPATEVSSEFIPNCLVRKRLAILNFEIYCYGTEVLSISSNREGMDLTISRSRCSIPTNEN